MKGIAIAMEVPLELGLGEGFSLEKAVCSHGLFMMAPNYWESHTKTLFRPLTLHPDGDTYHVSISQPSPHSLTLLVYATHFISPKQRLSLLTQVRRMLRLSEVEDMNVNEFQKMHRGAKEKGFGRMFRSPTLFEDMIKCMLLCNCQWSRTLFMARALCELQWELKHPSFHKPILKVLDATSSIKRTSEDKSFYPDTPEGKESKGIVAPRKCSKLSVLFERAKAQIDANDSDSKRICPVVVSNSLQEAEDVCQFARGDDSNDFCNSCHSSTSIEGLEFFSHNRIGNFPGPGEIANLDEDFLAKHCGLGYRASRILNLARSIVEGKIQLTQLEEACGDPSLFTYSQLAEQLKEIKGFGPYTCSNVLMCMGFYHVVPSDSETVRHLNQVHNKGSTLKSVQRDVEMIYGNYAPYQFLAYWWEVWEFYNERFGKLSEMPYTDYKLITASNMRPKQRITGKRTRSDKDMKPQQKGETSSKSRPHNLGASRTASLTLLCDPVAGLRRGTRIRNRNLNYSKIQS